MLPYVTILGHTLSAYGLLGVLGFLAGLLLVLLGCPRFGLSRDDGVYLYVFSALGALAGAKLLYLLPRLPQMMADLPMLWTGQAGLFAQTYLAGGMVYYGGVLGALAAAVLTARWFSLELSDFFPVLVPAIPLFHAFGRVGCFCAGCCYGVEAPPPWGIAFSHAIAGPSGVSLLPVQLWESGAEALIFLFLLRYAGRGKDRRLLLVAYLLAYAPVRFLLEFFRGDPARGLFGPFSTSQWLSLAALAAAGVWLLRRRNHEYS
ncbi:prolipoprotein diacylglyceryl transferase [Intestinimonas massiliensis (ex Afouda et al. 2020)]|uniref:prolipoprotein diacylglyceryl transferase n=1 Tax=Intestinimonas massiliensis (ex Afouda et al. 2020) TaxID=1673721 RepID=UPI00103061B5|nr:prolipoprotein diacylglyceryl transferase family protein [Intestinimonas massiliensis (ex Afouda et al. 2020)]